MPIPAAILQRNPQQAWVQHVQRVCGPANVKVCYLPSPNEGAVVVDKAVPSRLHTHSATPAAARYSRQGLMWGINMDGSTQYLTSPDGDDLAMGDGTNEFNCAWFAIANVTDTANRRTFLSKWPPNEDWLFPVSAADKLGLVWVNNGKTITIRTDANAAVSVQGAMQSYGATYIPASALGSRANDALLYEGGGSVAVTATNNASYTAAGPASTAELAIGADSAHTAGFFQGVLVFVLFATGIPGAWVIGDLQQRARRLFRY